MKTTRKEFLEFKKEFMKYVDLFGLKDYRLVFEHTEVDGAYADILVNHDGRTAVIRLSDDCNEDWLGPKSNARHEAIHLLIAEVGYWARCRYTTPDEISAAEEGLVRVLEKVIL